MGTASQIQHNTSKNKHHISLTNQTIFIVITLFNLPEEIFASLLLLSQSHLFLIKQIHLHHM